VNRAVPIPKSRSSSPSIHTAEPRSDQRSGYLAAGFPRNYPSAANSGVASVGIMRHPPRPPIRRKNPQERYPRNDAKVSGGRVQLCSAAGSR
jgi:hypothetical protein